MAKKPSFNEFIEELGPERYYMDGELSRAQAAKYWREVYNRRYATMRSNVRRIGVAAKGGSNG